MCVARGGTRGRVLMMSDESTPAGNYTRCWADVVACLYLLVRPQLLPKPCTFAWRVCVRVYVPALSILRTTSARACNACVWLAWWNGPAGRRKVGAI